MVFQEQVKEIIRDEIIKIKNKAMRFSAGIVMEDRYVWTAGLKAEDFARKLTLPRKFPIPAETVPAGSVRIDHGPTDPSLAENYDLFFNTTTSKLKIWFSSAWHIMAVLDTSFNLSIAGRYLKE